MEDGQYQYTPDQFRYYFPNVSIETILLKPTIHLGENLSSTIPFAAYTLLFVIGTAGNAWVAFVVGRLVCHWLRGNGGLDTPTGATATGSRGMHIYILALCVFDLLALTCVPVLLVDMAYGQWTIPYSLICKLYLGGECLSKIGAPFLLTALSGFCYSSICGGGGAGVGGLAGLLGTRCDLGSSKTALRVVAVCLVAVVSLGYPIWYNADITIVIRRKNDTITKALLKCASHVSPDVQMWFMAYSFALGYIVPAALFTYFYSAVLYHVHKHARRMQGSRRARYFWKAAKTSMCLVIFYLACWTPYYINMLLLFAGVTLRSTAMTVFQYFIHMLPYLNCCGYPILYTLLNRNITDEYDRVTRRSRERREQSRQLQQSIGGGGRGHSKASHGARENSHGYWSNARSDDSPDRSVEIVARPPPIDKEPPPKKEEKAEKAEKTENGTFVFGLF